MTLLGHLTEIENDFNKDFFNKMDYQNPDPTNYSNYRGYLFKSTFIDKEEAMCLDSPYTFINFKELLLPFSLSSFQNGRFLTHFLRDTIFMIITPFCIILGFMAALFDSQCAGAGPMALFGFIGSTLRLTINVILFAVSIVTRFLATLYHVGDYFYTASKSNVEKEHISDELKASPSTESSFKI